MLAKYILTIDQGTSATKAIIFNDKGQIVQRYNTIHNQFYPNAGWVEHDAEEIYEKTVDAIHNVIAKSRIDGKDIRGISISNQRETVVVWDKITGKPVYNAVVWQCQRASDICKEIEKSGHANVIKEKTGLILSPYFSASKIKWILDNVKGAREASEKGRLIFGTMDCWLIWKLTKGRMHVTDYSNASRTQLFNIKTLKWDDELLEVFNIPSSMLPEVKFSDEKFGYTDVDGELENLIPITGVMGDSHAALFGQNCFDAGMAKVTYGTGSSIMMNTGGKCFESKKGLVTSLAWGFNGNVDYVLEGNINCTGATIKWLVEDLQLIDDETSCEKIATSIKDNDGVYLVPAFVGLGAPYWDSEAKASITGMTRGTKKAHIVRAALEAIAYQIKDVLDLMIGESNINLKEVMVDGGPSRNNFLMQFQSDMLNIDVVRNKIEEISATGSALMAGISLGIWDSIEEVKKLKSYDERFNNKIDSSLRDRLYNGWREAVKKTLNK